MNPNDTLQSYFFKVLFNIIPSTSMSFKLTLVQFFLPSFFSLMRATWLVFLIIVDLMILIKFDMSKNYGASYYALFSTFLSLRVSSSPFALRI